MFSAVFILNSKAEDDFSSKEVADRKQIERRNEIRKR